MYNSNDVAERIKRVAKEKKLSISQVLKNADLNFNTMSAYKTSMPKADNLAKIADVLDCSVDYLLGRETQETSTHLLDTDSQDLLEMFNALDAESQKQVLNYINSLYYIVKVNSNIK